MVVGLIPILIGVIGFLNDICHLLSLLVQFVLQLLIQVIENHSLFPQTVDNELELLVDSDSLIELLVGLVQSVLEDLYLFLEVVLAFGSRIHA